jgi:hypothetical protein
MNVAHLIFQQYVINNKPSIKNKVNTNYQWIQIERRPLLDHYRYKIFLSPQQKYELETFTAKRLLKFVHYLSEESRKMQKFT